MLNRSRIDELREEVGEDGLAEVVELFCEEVEEVLDELPSLSPVDLPGRLHFLKGSALNIGMDQVGRLCLDAEARMQSGSPDVPDIAAIRQAFDASRRALIDLV